MDSERNNTRILIVDDEQNARELLKSILSEIPGVVIAGEASSVDEAINILTRIAVEIILLDVQMPGRDGFNLLFYIREHHITSEIVFITAHEEYALQAIRAAAFDYLLKPVDKSGLKETLDKFYQKNNKRRYVDRIQHLINEIQSPKKIRVNDRTGFHMIDPGEILFCHADRNYSTMVLHPDRSIIVSMNLGKMEKLLSDFPFFRISRSVIINLSYLVRVDRKRMECIISNGQEKVFSVSRKYLRLLEHQCEVLND